jgi:hypothetical protein
VTAPWEKPPAPVPVPLVALVLVYTHPDAYPPSFSVAAEALTTPVSLTMSPPKAVPPSAAHRPYVRFPAI